MKEIIEVEDVEVRVVVVVTGEVFMEEVVLTFATLVDSRDIWRGTATKGTMGNLVEVLEADVAAAFIANELRLE